MPFDLAKIEKIRKLAIQAIVSNDILMEKLILKGGSAIDLIHRFANRASMDLDFSIEGDFNSNEQAALRNQVEKLLKDTFLEAGMIVHDFILEERPKRIADHLADFWGGYEITFKVIEKARFEKLHGNMDAIRRQSISVHPSNSTAFRIQISKYEYCSPRVQKNIDGYTVNVYAPILLVVEKLRAICQQMAGYEKIVPTIKPTARARDFFDIYTLTQNAKINLMSPVNLELIQLVFSAKRVPLSYLARIGDYREFHRSDFISVEATVLSITELKDYDFYFDFVLSIIPKLESFRIE